MTDNAAGKQRRKRRFRYPAPLPAPGFSACLYVRLAPKDVAMFRFLLEAEDNLAYISTADRWACVLRVIFSPHQEKAVRRCLESMRDTVTFSIILDGAPRRGADEKDKNRNSAAPGLNENIRQIR